MPIQEFACGDQKIILSGGPTMQFSVPIKKRCRVKITQHFLSDESLETSSATPIDREPFSRDTVVLTTHQSSPENTHLL